MVGCLFFLYYSFGLGIEIIEVQKLFPFFVFAFYMLGS